MTILIIFLIGFSVWWWFILFHPTPTPGQQCKAVDPGTICLSTGVLAAVESQFDSSIPTPVTTLKLDSFNMVTGYAPWCIPSFYAIRFIDQDGNYGGMSDWFGPIVAGKSTKQGGCMANLPYLKLDDASDPNIGKYYANVHRQDGTLDKDSDGTVMGMLYSKVNTFIDSPATGPNSSYTVTPCKGC